MSFTTGYTAAFGLYLKASSQHVGNLTIQDLQVGKWDFVPSNKGIYAPPHIFASPCSGTIEENGAALSLKIPYGLLFGTIINFAFIGSHQMKESYNLENGVGPVEAILFQFAFAPQAVAAKRIQAKPSGLCGFVVQVG